MCVYTCVSTSSFFFSGRLADSSWPEKSRPYVYIYIHIYIYEYVCDYVYIYVCIYNTYAILAQAPMACPVA